MTQVKTSPAPEQPEASEPLLTLSTAAPVRPIVAIDEHPFEMALMGDFGIVEQQLISREGAEFQKLWMRDKLNSAQSGRLKDLLDRQFSKVLPGVDAGLTAKLNDEDRAQVVLSFMLEPLRKAQERALASQQQSQGVADWVAELVERELSEDERAQLTVLLEQARNQKPGESSTSAS